MTGERWQEALFLLVKSLGKRIFVVIAQPIGLAGVLERGRNLVRDGRSDTALAELGRVREIDPGTSFDPAQEIERVKKAGE